MGDAASEEAVIDALHEHRTAAAMALLNQYNPQWFPDSGMGGLANTDEASADGGSGSSGSGDVDRDVDDDGEGGRKSAASTHVSPARDERQRAAAAVARQRAAAMALLNEHNSDWFGGARPGEKKSPTTTTTTKRKSLLRMIGKGRKSNNTATYNYSNTSMSRRGSFSVLADVTSSERPTPTPTPTATIAPSPRSLSIRMGIRSESPPTSTIRHSMGRLSLRSAAKGAKTQKAVSGQAAPGSSSSDKPKKHRGSSPWFSRHGSGLSASSCPATPADAGVHRGITARSPEVDDNPGHGKRGESISSGVRRSSPTPTIQAPLMDVLENKSQEPMSLRSMLRFARENLMEENVLFYLEVVSFKTGGGGQGEYLTHLKRIQELYIQTASPREVNISGDIRASTLRSVESILTDTGNAIGAGNSSVVSSAACELSHGNGDVSDDEPDDGLGDRSEETQSMPLGPQETRMDAEESCASMDARLRAAAAAAEADSAGPTAATTTTKPPETLSEVVETIWRDGDANREATSDAREEVAERHSNHGRLSQPSIYPLASTLTPAPPLPPRPPIPTPVPKATVAADFTTTTAAASVTEAAADGIVLAPDVGRTDAAQEGQSQNSPVNPAGGSEKPTKEATAGAEDEGGTMTGGSASSASKGANGSGSGTEGGRGGRESEEGSKQRGEEKGEGEDEDWKCRERDCAMSWDDCAGSSAGAAGKEGHFDVSMEIEQLGLSIGPGGGYGDRSIFDSALLEIFVLLRHEVYPKFVARVMKRSRGMMTAANASTSISSAGSTRSTTPDSSARSMGEQPAPWSQSDEGGKSRRFSFSRRR